MFYIVIAFCTNKCSVQGRGSKICPPNDDSTMRGLNAAGTIVLPPTAKWVCEYAPVISCGLGCLLPTTKNIIQASREVDTYDVVGRWLCPI